MADNTSSAKHITKLDFDISEIKNQLNQVEKMLDDTVKKIKDQKIDLDSSSAKKSVEDYNNSIKKIPTSTKTAQESTNNFLKTITDKARWLAAFYLITMVEDAFIATIDTIVETENAVIELQRVLNEDIGNVPIQQELYDIAQNFGRSFEEVSDTAVKFAQTGASWNETLKLTEATMLAVNTAELEVESATTGLIAVIAQFNLDANDMVSVIDKINITADNFAVTSEKIVAALQRTGSAAVNAGLSLEQTIGLVTQMSVATGRSGESIGTALNSLLVYSQRSSSMEIFASLSSEMETLVEKFNSGSASIIDIWQRLSVELQDREKQISLSQMLGEDSAYEQTASALELDASEITSEIKDIYGIAGTHRQNYFISLVNDMANYQGALDEMATAEGYSLSENEQAMSTLTRQYQSLIENVSLLAVQFGNAGFLDFLKTIVAMGNGAVELVRELGGLRTVLAAVATVLILIKSQQISSFLTNIISIIPSAINGFKNFASTISLVSKELAKGKASQLSFGQAIEMVFGGIGNVVAAGIGIAITAISYFNQKQEEARQKAAENTAAFKNQIDELSNLKTQYDETAASIEDESERNATLAGLKDDLIEKYQLEEEALAGVNDERQQYMDLVNQEIQSEYSKWWAENREEIERARDALNELNYIVTSTDTRKGFLSNYDFEKEAQLIDEYNLKISEWEGNTKQFGVGVAAETDLEAYEIIGKIIEDITKQSGEMDETTKYILDSLQKTYDDLGLSIEQYGQIVSDADQIQVDYYKNLLGFQEEQISTMTDATEKSKLYSDAIALIGSDGNLTAESIQALTEWLDNLFSATGTTDTELDISAITYDAEEAAESISELTTKLDNAQSSFKNINDVMEQYNATGQLDIDMMQQLMSLSGEYAAMLNFEGGQLSYVDGATGQVINSKQALIASYIQEQTAAQIASLAESLLAEQLSVQESASYNSANANAALANSFSYVVSGAINGTQSILNFNKVVAAYGQQQGLQGDFLSRFQSGSQQILSNAQNMYGQIGQMASSPSTWGSDGIQQASQAAQDANDAQIEALEKQKEAVEDRYNAEIDALKKVQEQTERLRDSQDYERNIASASSRSGAEYREEQDTLEREWQRQQEDWAIEDTIEKLEELRDKEVAIIDEQIEMLRNKASSFSSGLVSGATAANAQVVGNYANDVVEANAEVTEEALNNYKEGYVDPITQLMIETAEKISNETLLHYQENFFIPFKASVDEMFAYLVNKAELNSKEMYGIYYRNFISPMISAYSLLNNPLVSNALGITSPIYNNNNNSKNSNIYINSNSSQSSVSGLEKYYTLP